MVSHQQFSLTSHRICSIPKLRQTCADTNRQRLGSVSRSQNHLGSLGPGIRSLPDIVEPTPPPPSLPLSRYMATWDMPAGAPGLQSSKDVGSLRSVQLGTNSQYRPESSVCLRTSPTNSSFRRVSSSSFHEGWAFIWVPHLFPSLLQMQVINCTLYFLGFHLLSLLVFFLQPTPSNIKLVTMFP